VNHAHTAAAAARGSFYDYRIPDRRCNTRSFIFILDDAVETRRYGHTRRFHCRTGPSLVAHQLNRGGIWSDKLYVAGLADFGEIRVFCQESIARMNGVDVGYLSGGNDRGNIQIAFG